MVIIESRHIMDKVRESCPLSISFSLARITLLQPSSNKPFGFARFESISGEEKEVTCAWWVNLMPEMSELVIKWIGKEEVFTVEL